MKIKDIYKNALDFCYKKMDQYSLPDNEKKFFHAEELRSFKRNYDMYHIKAIKITKRLGGL